jgi:hypothetical protein
MPVTFNKLAKPYRSAERLVPTPFGLDEPLSDMLGSLEPR